MFQTFEIILKQIPIRCKVRNFSKLVPSECPTALRTHVRGAVFSPMRDVIAILKHKLVILAIAGLH